MQKRTIGLISLTLIIVAILAAVFYYCAITYFRSNTVQPKQLPPATQSHTYTHQILDSRNKFISKYAAVPKFIEDYLLISPVVKLSNNTAQPINLDLNEALYSWSRIDAELSPVKQDQDGAIKLFNFMKSKIHLTEFLNYEYSQNISYPPLYLSFFSSGRLSTAASDLALLAFHFKFKARTVRLINHTVTEIYYDNTWHMFDLQYAGYIMDEEKTILDLASIRKMAKKNYFPDKSYNVAFSRVGDNENINQELMNKATTDLILPLLPDESLNFYANLWMLTTDGKNLEHESMKNPESFLQIHSVKIANLTREIPLSSLSTEQLKQVEFNSLFPLSGVFIVYQQERGKDIGEAALPEVFLQTNKLHPDYELERYLKPSRYFVFKNTVVISLSEFLSQLENEYSTSIKIADLGKTLEYNPGSKLLLVYQYVPSNVAWGKLLLEGQKEKMNIQYNFDGTGLIN